MHFRFALLACLLGAFSISAAERRFDFQADATNTFAGFRSTVAGEGRPGEWKIVMDEVPPLLQPLTPHAPSVSRKPVLAQVSQDATDEHFPMLVFEDETYRDFTLTARLKTVAGEKEQMAGIAFRFQDEKNFYVVRISSLGNSFRFYKMVGGQRGGLIGPQVEIPAGVWHELAIECQGNQIRFRLNGKELIPPITDTSFTRGKIAFWTKSDSVSYFCDAKLEYTPVESPAQIAIRDALKEFPRLLGLKIIAPKGDGVHIVASNETDDVGQPGSGIERDVIAQGKPAYGKSKEQVTITSPIRDKNGEAIAAARIVMKSFAGQTEQNALTRALPIVKLLQSRIQDTKDLAP